MRLQSQEGPDIFAKPDQKWLRPYKHRKACNIITGDTLEGQEIIKISLEATIPVTLQPRPAVFPQASEEQSC
jgi:hypothetical protein